MEKFVAYGKGDKNESIRRCQILFEKLTQLMKASERKIGRKPYKHGFASSTLLRRTAEEVIQMKKKLRHEKIQKYKNTKLIAQLEDKEKVLKKNLKTVQKDANKHREEDLDCLATKRASE